MTRHIKAPCPLCHATEGLTVRMIDDSNDDGCATLDVQLVRINCECSDDDLMSGPFDETVEVVLQWNSDCYPYAIKGEWNA